MTCQDYRPEEDVQHPKTITDALLGLLVLAADRPRDEHGRLIVQFLDQYQEIGIQDPIAKETAFRAGYAAGFIDGESGEVHGGAGADDAWAEHLEGLS